MIKYIFFLFFLFFSIKTLCNEIKIINDLPGTGKKIIKNSKIKINYTGMLDDGTIFDTSYERNQPFSFQIGTRKVIEGLELGLIGMREGGKRTIVIPYNLAYGKKGAANIIPPKANLTFEIEIISVSPPGYQLLETIDLEKKQEKGFIVIDIRSQKEINKTGKIPNSIIITAFNEEGKFQPNFLNTYQSNVTISDNVVLVSQTGDVSSILANGFVEELGAQNMYSLQGGAEAYFDKKIINHH